MSWKASFRTSWRRATAQQVFWHWDRSLTWSWPVTWEEPVPWLHPSVSLCVCKRERETARGRTRISPRGLDCYSASTPSVRIMQTEYLHCQGAELSDSCDSEQPWNSRNRQKVVDAIFFKFTVSIKEPLWLVSVMNCSIFAALMRLA